MNYGKLVWSRWNRLFWFWPAWAVEVTKWVVNKCLVAAVTAVLTCFLLLNVFTGSRCGLSCHRAHPGQQGPQDEEAHLPRPRPHQPLHELSLPHWDDPHWEGADRPQTRRGGCPEEKGMKAHIIEMFRQNWRCFSLSYVHLLSVCLNTDSRSATDHGWSHLFIQLMLQWWLLRTPLD